MYAYMLVLAVYLIRTHANILREENIHELLYVLTTLNTRICFAYLRKNWPP